MKTATTPIKVADILMERTKPRVVAATGPISISLNTGMGNSSVSTIATRPPKKIFCIVSWNVETYGESKANRNPYANKLIGLIMKALEVDLMMMMETQDFPEDVISSLQHDEVGVLANKTDKKQAIANIFAPQLAKQIEQEVPLWLSNLEAAAQGTLPYQAISTAQTGKLPALPPRFGLYKAKAKDIPRCSKFFSVDPERQNNASWKEYIPVLYKGYDLQMPPYKQVKTFQEVNQIYESRTASFAKQEEMQFVARATCFKCAGGKYLLPHGSTVTVLCDGCAGTGTPSEADLREVAYCLNEILESPDIETYVSLYRCGKSAIVHPGVPLQAEDQKGAKLFLGNCSLLSLDKQQQELGFQDPEKSFNGRCPIFLPLILNLDGRDDLSVPIVQFHAPFGSSLEPRKDSILALSQLGVPGSTGHSMEDMAHAIIVGDFNLDYDPSSTTSYSGQAYGGMRGKGFECVLGGVKTSCMTLEPGLKAVAVASWPTANAYDNFLVKGKELQDSIITACAIDVFDFMKNNPTDFAYTPQSGHFSKPAEYQNYASQWPSYSADEQMFFVYRKFISDHIPVLLDIEVDDLSPLQQSQLELRQQALQHQLQMWQAAHTSPQSATYSPLSGTVSNLAVNPSHLPDQVKHLTGNSFAITGTVHSVDLSANTAVVHILSSPTALVYHVVTVDITTLPTPKPAQGACLSFQLDTAPPSTWRDPTPVTIFPLSGRVVDFQALPSPAPDSVDPGGPYLTTVVGHVEQIDNVAHTITVIAEISDTIKNQIVVPFGQIPFGVQVVQGQSVSFGLSNAPLQVENVNCGIGEFQVLPTTVPEKLTVINQKRTVTGHIEAIGPHSIIVLSKKSEDAVYKFEILRSAIPTDQAQKMLPAMSVQFVIP